MLRRDIDIFLRHIDGKMKIVSKHKQDLTRIVSSKLGEFRMLGNPCIIRTRDWAEHLAENTQFFYARR